MTADEQTRQLQECINSLMQQIKDLKSENIALKWELEDLLLKYDCITVDYDIYPADITEEQRQRLNELESERNSMNKIEDGLFHHSILEDVNLPDKLEEIGCDVFNDCPNLSGLDIPESVKKIGSGFCKNCPSIKEITFRGLCPEGLSDAFAGCSSLRYIFVRKGEVVKYKAAMPDFADKILGRDWQ